jgi:hypothetical protein
MPLVGDAYTTCDANSSRLGRRAKGDNPRFSNFTQIAGHAPNGQPRDGIGNQVCSTACHLDRLTPPPFLANLMHDNVLKTYPPDGETKAWWDRLKRALGTSSSAFVNASLLQLQAAARLPFGGISETAVNAALAIIEAAAPKDEIESGWPR